MILTLDANQLHWQGSNGGIIGNSWHVSQPLLLLPVLRTRTARAGRLISVWRTALVIGRLIEPIRR